MSITNMVDYFKLSDDEEMLYTDEILPEGFKVNITLPDRITNEQIAYYFYLNVPLTCLCGMNKHVGDTTVVVETLHGESISVSFNRVQQSN